MSYRLLDHTADLRLEVEAPTRNDLFAEAAAALTHCLTEPERVEAQVTRAIILAADDLGTLMVDWLTELLVLFEVEGLLAARARVEVAERGAGLSLTAEVWGEPRDAARHPVKTLVKGVTYHALEVGPAEDAADAAGAWRTRITLDL